MAIDDCLSGFSGLFDVRRRQLLFLIQSFEYQVGLRLKLKDVNLAGIDRDACRVYSRIFDLQQLSYSVDKVSFLENRLLDLEREKRDQEVRCWEDAVNLQRLLIYALSELRKLDDKEWVLGKND